IEMTVLAFAPTGNPTLLFWLFLVNRALSGVAEAAASGADEALAIADGAEVIFGLVPPELFRRAEALRWVHAIAAGVDMYLYPEFVASDIVLTCEKGLVGEHLADHAFGLLLMLTRQLAAACRLGAEGWNHRSDLRRKEFELTGLTMGLFGFGGTGRATARRARAFGMECIALDREPVPPSPEVPEVMSPERLNDLLSASDVLSICCPLTSETRGLFDGSVFARMKHGAYVVNVTRGEVLVEADLVQALESGRLAGAALDVAPREPLPPDSPLWHLPNVVMTPHTAGASQFRAARNIDRFVRNLLHLRRGEELEGVVDKQAGY
ncbi:MAG: D-2-hydroxyacid dehydrogenase, partial [Dehalococcoidia bacterium]